MRLYIGSIFWCLLVVPAVSLICNVQNVTDCSCGYYDPAIHEFYTDSAIVYFNETNLLSGEVFVPEAYENKYEKGWNSRYTQGSARSNVDIGMDDAAALNTSLRLYVDPSDHHHHVMGGSVQTVRKDIFYGSFRALMRSPRSTITGSALSMTLHHNDSQTINLDIMTPDDTEKAWVGLFMRNEFPDRDLGANFSALSNTSNIDPWHYTEYRIDWSEKKVDYYIGGILFRSVKKDSKLNYPETPSPLRFKHWSVGNWFTMQGPPENRSEANVGWVRSFFNSSLTTDDERKEFTARCDLRQACSTDNMALRGASPFSSKSVAAWKQAELPSPARNIPKTILIICGCLSGFLVTNALARRIPRRSKKSKLIKELEKFKERKFHPLAYRPTVQPMSDSPTAMLSPPRSRPISYFADTARGTPMPASTPVGQSDFSLGDYLYSQKSAGTSIKTFDTKSKKPRMSWREYSDNFQVQLQTMGTAPPRTAAVVQHIPDRTEPRSYTHKTTRFSEDLISPVTSGPPVVTFQESGVTAHSGSSSQDSISRSSSYNSPQRPAPSYFRTRVIDDHASAEEVRLSEDDSEDERCKPVTTQLRKTPRVDYLAGLLVFSCILVTAIQFSLTFSPASVDPGADPHYKTETWVRKTIGAYFLNLVWVGECTLSLSATCANHLSGPFLLTSTRFLVQEYLESNGDLLAVAQLTVKRPFRLLIPIFAIAMLEYFFMDSGAINWLEYMASVTWSTWPFTRVPNNFGYFLSEILELAYLIPNAAPQITFSYCTGVLWSIPVQLQGSWIALLGVIVIKEIKTPWKRFGYYSFCMLMHWYALSWGTYFYFGIMLADLEVNYRYRRYLYARPLIYYPLIFVCILAAFGGLTIDMITQWTGVNYAAWEYGIHPDGPTGQPIMLTGAVGYPQYYVPKLNGIVFAFGLQALVELSPLAQNFFAQKIFTFAFRHIFTIYLIHGFVFWSLGSTIFIYLSKHDFDYWKIVTIVAICCYSTLFLGVPILTPLVNALGKYIPRNVWQYANEPTSPRKPTLYPFPNNFLFVRTAFVQDAGAVAAVQQSDKVATKPRAPFKKFVASVAAAVSSRFSNQPLSA